MRYPGRWLVASLALLVVSLSGGAYLYLAVFHPSRNHVVRLQSGKRYEVEIDEAGTYQVLEVIFEKQYAFVPDVVIDTYHRRQDWIAIRFFHLGDQRLVPFTFSRAETIVDERRSSVTVGTAELAPGTYEVFINKHGTSYADLRRGDHGRAISARNTCGAITVTVLLAEAVACLCLFFTWKGNRRPVPAQRRRPVPVRATFSRRAWPIVAIVVSLVVLVVVALGVDERHPLRHTVAAIALVGCCCTIIMAGSVLLHGKRVPRRRRGSDPPEN